MERLCNILIFSSVNMPSALVGAIYSCEDIEKWYKRVDSLDKLLPLGSTSNKQLIGVNTLPYIVFLLS